MRELCSFVNLFILLHCLKTLRYNFKLENRKQKCLSYFFFDLLKVSFLCVCVCVLVKITDKSHIY